MINNTIVRSEDVGYETELQTEFTEDLIQVNDQRSFKLFLLKWHYWLDSGTHSLTSSDWEWIQPLIADCRDESVIPDDEHDPAIKLLMPGRILKVSALALRYEVPWGTAYIHMREQKTIDY